MTATTPAKRQKIVTATPEQVPGICQELRNTQRMRSVVIKSRIMQANRIQSIVAGTLGYYSQMPEKERTKVFSQASALINEILEGGGQSCAFWQIVQQTYVGIRAFNGLQADYEKEMLGFAKRLPVAKWVQEKDQTGFGLLYLGIVIGETGDLNNYPNPAKLWRRLGCAPWSFNGETKMGATWRSGKEGKLPAAEWDQYGYSPRRRSISYLLGDLLMKQNFKQQKHEDGTATVLWKGPYRARYEEGRRVFAERHPEYKPQRHHLHGMLVATKLLLKNLWIEWRK